MANSIAILRNRIYKPHLSNPMQWFIFICSYYAFRPKTKNRLYERKHVFECNACIQICTHQAIQLKVNQEGFAYPEIDSEKCINCNLCNKVCPMQNGDKTKSVNIKTLAVQTLDNKTLQKVVLEEYFLSLLCMYLTKAVLFTVLLGIQTCNYIT